MTDRATDVYHLGYQQPDGAYCGILAVAAVRDVEATGSIVAHPMWFGVDHALAEAFWHALQATDGFETKPWDKLSRLPQGRGRGKRGTEL